MSEGTVDGIGDRLFAGYDDPRLSPRQVLALRFADRFLAGQGAPPPDEQAALAAEFTAEELAELSTGLALFCGFSKLMIALGCEPAEMDLTELPTPGTARR